MEKYARIYTLFLLLVCCTSGKGQTKIIPTKDNTKAESKDVIPSQGPGGITRTIKQDRKGNIWIASWDGVFRYDGKSFTNITSKVSSARFFSVLEDRKGNFWFSSVGSGVYYYNGKSFRNFTTKDGLANDRVSDMYEDKTGNIWFCTEDGASRYDGKSFRNYRMDDGRPKNVQSSVDFTKREKLINNDVGSIIEDRTGIFWFGTRGHAFVYDGKTFTKVTHNGKPFTNVRSIIEDKKGNIWLGGNDGLWRYDRSAATNFENPFANTSNGFTNFYQKFVGYIYEDKKGNILTSSVSTHDSSWSLSRYDEKSLSNKNPTATEIKSNEGMIFGSLEAYDGSIWFGTLKGVYRYDGNTTTGFKGK
ncbi:MAG: histidine kinase [Cytophagales bacterium]|nr:histidine kinase [Cytophagales bacterium]